MPPPPSLPHTHTEVYNIKIRYLWGFCFRMPWWPVISFRKRAWRVAINGIGCTSLSRSSGVLAALSHSAAFYMLLPQAARTRVIRVGSYRCNEKVTDRKLSIKWPQDWERRNDLRRETKKKPQLERGGGRKKEGRKEIKKERKKWRKEGRREYFGQNTSSAEKLQIKDWGQVLTVRRQ